MNNTAPTNYPIQVSDAAARRVKVLIEEEENNDLKLRVFVTGGGCSGFQYGFSFDEKTNDGDTEIAHLGVSLLVDPMSFQYLLGSEIDYTEGLQGARFVINNPNAKTTCGCGSSFTV
ncbi:MAG: iron-sulfur cluster insertion protein [Enterobacterales bacterium]|jgi:iron-sulfur cluster insertion protein